MADYIYLLENRLSVVQKAALQTVRDLARAKGFTVFLVGGAVRDLTSGSPVRDLDVAVQGNALKLKKDLTLAGAVIAGEYEPGQALFVRFPGGVRMEIGSTLSATWPRPGKPVYKPGTILEDLRRRDFTANAMALSLNDGSYGLLMDPLNGVADIENRQFRLASNYGFIEDPARMIRAARLMARLGWTLEEKTQTRYDNGRTEGYISALQEFQRGYELEEIVHEDDPLRVLKGLETEGWMKFLAPFWNTAKANVTELERLREVQTQLQMQGVHPDASSAHFPLLTAKLTPKEVEQIKASFPRPGFVAEIDGLEAEAKEFASQLTAKSAATPSQAWKLITSASPEAVLWVAFSSKSAAIQAKFKSFFTEWPLVRQKIPYALMQEMRITPELPGYAELVEKLFFELMDGNLSTVEEMKAFLEPYSPPAPPPPVNMRRLRASKKDAKGAKARGRKALVAKLDDDEDGIGDDDDVDVDVDAEDDDEAPIDLPPISDDEDDLPLDDEPGDDADSHSDDDADSDSGADDEEDAPAPKPPPAKKKAAKGAKAAAPVAEPVAAVKVAAKAPAKAGKSATKPANQPVNKTVAKPVAAKAVPMKAAPAKVAPAKPAKAAPVKVVGKKVVAPVKKSVAAAKKVVAPAKKAVAKKVAAPVKASKSAARKVAKKVVAKKAVAPVKKAAATVKKAVVPARKVPAKKIVAKVAPVKAPAVKGKTAAKHALAKGKGKPVAPAKGKKR